MQYRYMYIQRCGGSGLVYEPKLNYVCVEQDAGSRLKLGAA